MEAIPAPISFLADRVWVYVLAAVLLAVEAALPHRPEAGMPYRRWGLHAMLFATASALGWITAGGMAWLGGLLNAPPRPEWAGWWHLAMVLLALDLASYWLHRVKHRMKMLWAWHRLHHADTSLDATTTARHHPLDALVTGLSLGLVAIVIGARPVQVAAYGTVAFSVQIAAHANLRFPATLSWLGAVFVTPSLHHLHHAPDVCDTDSNYGEVLSVWDRLFRTYNPPRGPVAFFGVAPAEPPSDRSGSPA